MIEQLRWFSLAAAGLIAGCALQPLPDGACPCPGLPPVAPRINALDGLVTGYYEPLLRGSRARATPFVYPVYGPPDDLLTIDLSAINPELRGMRLRGRVEGKRVVPYYSRAEIARE